MKDKIIGSFVFTNVGNGCLTSKYVNNRIHTPFVEACKIVNLDQNLETFIGYYRTTWIDSINQSIFANLNISFDPQSNESIFILKWSHLDDSPIFEGIGMIYQGNLVGSYWSI